MENNSMHNITDAGKREKIFEGMGGGGGGGTGSSKTKAPDPSEHWQ